MSTSRGFAAVLSSLFFSKDDIPSWAGAHDLNMAGQFQGGLQLFLDLVSKDDIHIWAGAHDLEMTGQFQGVCSCSQVSFQKMIFILGRVPMIWKCQVNFRGGAAVLRYFFQR